MLASQCAHTRVYGQIALFLQKMCKTTRFFLRNTCKLFISFTRLLMYDLFRPFGLISTDTHPWTVFAGGGSFKENSGFSTCLLPPRGGEYGKTVALFLKDLVIFSGSISGRAPVLVLRPSSTSLMLVFDNEERANLCYTQGQDAQHAPHPVSRGSLVSPESSDTLAMTQQLT